VRAHSLALSPNPGARVPRFVAWLVALPAALGIPRFAPVERVAEAYGVLSKEWWARLICLRWLFLTSTLQSALLGGVRL
jgi:hypothetical protein